MCKCKMSVFPAAAAYPVVFTVKDIFREQMQFCDFYASRDCLLSCLLPCLASPLNTNNAEVQIFTMANSRGAFDHSLRCKNHHQHYLSFVWFLTNMFVVRGINKNRSMDNSSTCFLFAGAQQGCGLVGSGHLDL